MEVVHVLSGNKLPIAVLKKTLLIHCSSSNYSGWLIGVNQNLQHFYRSLHCTYYRRQCKADTHPYDIVTKNHKILII